MEAVLHIINHWLVPPALIIAVEGSLMQFDRLEKFFGVKFIKGERKRNGYIAIVFTLGLFIGVIVAHIIAG